MPAIATDALAGDGLSVSITESFTRPGTFTARIEGDMRGDSMLPSRDGMVLDLMGRLVALGRTLHIMGGGGYAAGEDYDTGCRIRWHSNRSWYTENGTLTHGYPCSRIYHR